MAKGKLQCLQRTTFRDKAAFQCKKRMAMKMFFTQLRVLYLALLAGQLLFLGVILYLNGLPDGLGSLSTDDPLLLVGVTVTFMAIFTAFGMDEYRKKQGTRLSHMEEKSAHYRTSLIIRSALTEGAGLFALALALATQKGFLYALFTATFTAFLYFRPSAEEFIRHYALRPEEEAQLQRELKG